MSERFPTPVLGPIQRQLRRVRWRHNAAEVQRVAFLIAAGAAAAAAALVVLALRARPLPFLIGAGGLGLAWLGLGGAALWRLHRRWVGAHRTPAWVDRRARLRGRLVTLVERKGVGRAAFGPLLVERNARGLDDWRPGRVVPAAVPHGALAALLAAAAALVAVLTLAPHLRPRAPRLVYVAGAGDDWPQGIDGVDGGAETLAVAPANGAEAPSDGRPPERATGDAPREGQILVDARSLQQRIRDSLWGKDAGDGATAAGERERKTGQGRDARRERGGTARDDAAPADDADAESRAGGTATAARNGRQGDGTTGAGTGTDPNLFGIPTAVPHTSEAAFQLALAARVRAEHAEPRPPEGPAPAAAPDLRPALADRQRNEAAVHRMPVPPRYEPLVRTLFAHRADDRP
jgi:hypothetical protein